MIALILIADGFSGGCCCWEVFFLFRVAVFGFGGLLMHAVEQDLSDGFFSVLLTYFIYIQAVQKYRG